jgi:hypothetical protein
MLTIAVSWFYIAWLILDKALTRDDLLWVSWITAGLGIQAFQVGYWLVLCLWDCL